MKRAGSLSNNDLMAACRENGKGGGWEAEAIEHWRWQLANGEGKERVLAWVKLHSIARGSPKCVDEARRPLRVESCAADLGLALQTVLNHCTALVAEGRVRLKKTQLWYRADVPEEVSLAAAPVADATKDENSWVHGNFPAYVADSYWKESTEKRAKIREAWTALTVWRKQAFLEGLAGLRHEISRVEVSTLQALGLPKFVAAKTAALKPHWFQPMLLDEPSFVHGKGSRPVSVTLNNAETGGVQDGPSLLSFTPDQTAMKSPPPSPTENLQLEVMVVAHRIEGLSLKTAEALLNACRAVEPSLRALEVVHLAEAKLRASPGAHRPVGLLLKTLADEASGPPLARAREAARREEEKMAAHFTELEGVLNDPQSSASDLEWARGELAKAKGA